MNITLMIWGESIAGFAHSYGAEGVYIDWGPGEIRQSAKRHVVPPLLSSSTTPHAVN